MANALNTISKAHRGTQFRVKHETDTNTYYIEAKTRSGRKYYGAIGMTKDKAQSLLKSMKKKA